MKKLTPVSVRLARRLRVDEETGCHIWTGAIVHGGYGQIGTGGRGNKARAHRVAYELAKGPIPPGLVIDHLCRNRLCCNPDHLEAVTQQTNVLRGEGPGKATKSTHCPAGHLYDAENTARTSRGWRYCRICKRDSGARNSRRRALEQASTSPTGTK